ncbi:hypothetical protein BEP19_08435 [Ammoniphilus oxalaticus]|uniref:Prenylated flavin chaperone LpdD-like domain-containing protein n=1 Tax=Ammoniphilus oxalaticus TaxID=66863 RepID=A0A419SL18_9BACL|nr:hypothetical protein BEP19_08435 [Ammoniphilus oxalaticus]
MVFDVQKLGDDYVFVITGGKAHIGASATAYYYEDQLQVEGVALPRHKEWELARELALQAAEQLGVTVTVVMGIHVDQASREMIDSIIVFVRQEMNRQLVKVGNASS